MSETSSLFRARPAMQSSECKAQRTETGIQLLKPTFYVAFFTLISRILGFVRDMLLARFFGTSAAMEAFLVAFRLPNFIRRLFAEGSVTQALVPFLSAENHQKYRALFQRQLITVTGVLMFFLTLIGMLFSGVVILIFAPGFIKDPLRFHLANNLLKIMLPYGFFISVTSIFTAILNSRQHFSIPAMTPIILNVLMIACLIISPLFPQPIYVVALAVLIAGVVQCLIQIPVLLKLKVRLKPILKWPSQRLIGFLKRLLPAIFGASIIQISLLIETIFASFLPTGSLSWLYYAEQLNQFPLSIFGIALATVILPYLARTVSNEDYSKILNFAVGFTLIIAVPATAAIIILAKPLMITLFRYGHFTAFDVSQSSRVLIALAAGLSGFILIKVCVSALYARRNMKAVIRIGLFAILINILLNFVLVFLLAPYHLGYLGLAVSTAVTANINALMLLLILSLKYHFRLKGKSLGILLLRVLMATTVMGAVLFVIEGNINSWLSLGIIARALKLFSFIAIGMASYFLCLILLGIRRRDFWL